MKILIQQAFITDSNSPHNGQVKDILVEDGKIRQMADHLAPDGSDVVHLPGLYVSPGWVDIFANFADPGYEFKETLYTGTAAAAAGGFTDVFVVSNTKPALDNKAQVEYIRQKSKSLPVNVYPIGSVSRNNEGRELAEMYDMHSSGAIAFGDGTHPVQSAGLLLKALQYVKAFNGIIIQIPDDKSVGTNGLINEGIVSTRLGLPGKPMMAEELIVARDIKLARYAESRIHFTGVSSPKSIEYIKRAKDSGLDVTCSVTPYHLHFSDEDLMGYDTNLKVYPPLRTKAAVKVLRASLLDGTIDCVATHHLPHEYDSKVLEFEYAKYGMTGLETCFSLLRTSMPDLSVQRIVELVSSNPRQIFGLRQPVIETGNAAILSLFQPDASWIYGDKAIHSKSRNSPLVGKDLQGKPVGIINEDRVFLEK